MCVCATGVYSLLFLYLLLTMSTFLLNWVNKRPSDCAETENRKKKLALESAETVVENVESPTERTEHIPICWNKSQYDNFKLSYDWLLVENQKLGCAVCKKIMHLGLFGEKNLRISKPWQECSVVSNGKTKDSQMSSLRKKIHEHKNSDAHIKAAEIVQQSEKKQIEKI